MPLYARTCAVEIRFARRWSVTDHTSPLRVVVGVLRVRTKSGGGAAAPQRPRQVRQRSVRPASWSSKVYRPGFETAERADCASADGDLARAGRYGSPCTKTADARSPRLCRLEAQRHQEPVAGMRDSRGAERSQSRARTAARESRRHRFCEIHCHGAARLRTCAAAAPTVELCAGGRRRGQHGRSNSLSRSCCRPSHRCRT